VRYSKHFIVIVKYHHRVSLLQHLNYSYLNLLT